MVWGVEGPLNLSVGASPEPISLKVPDEIGVK